MTERDASWPDLPFNEWQATAETLHMWTQIVGKIRLTLTPWINHSWHVTLYVTSRGLTTSPIPHGLHMFEIDFDFIDHELRILKSDGGVRALKMRPQSVAEFYNAAMNALDELNLHVKIDNVPNEIADPIPFDQDQTHRSYDPEYANRFWRAKVRPAEASYSAQLHEFVLPYDVVRTAPSPDDVLLDFAQSVYDAASTLGDWDRAALEESSLNPPKAVA